jgi:hypothetical protein
MRIEVDEDLETVQKNLFPYPGDRAKKLGITANVIGDGFWKRHPSTGEWIQGFRALALGKTAGLE